MKTPTTSFLILVYTFSQLSKLKYCKLSEDTKVPLARYTDVNSMDAEEEGVDRCTVCNWTKEEVGSLYKVSWQYFQKSATQ